MNVKNRIPFLLTLLAVASCGENKTTAKLEISTSYTMAAPEYNGGFIVVGENSNGKKFSLALDKTNQTKIQLEAGTWKFAAFGWDGDMPFGGSAKCGLVTDFNLSGQNSTIKIDLSSYYCVPSFFQFSSDLKLRGCDILYTYNKNTDTFSPLSPEHNISFCNSANMPANYVSGFKYFRISALNGTNASDLTRSLTSACHTLNMTSGLNLPASKVPFIIDLYKTEDDCNASRAAQTYTFPEGLSAGNPNEDSLFSPLNKVLVLATAPTKKGKSPFMAEIPRILCGSPGSFIDCMEEPNPSADIKVNFYGNHWDEKTILRNINPTITTCSPSTVLSSTYFTTDKCKVRERSVKINPLRNEFNCQDLESASNFLPNQTIQDVQLKGDKIYILSNDILNQKFLHVYSPTGKKLYEGGPFTTSANRVTATESGDHIILSNDSQLFFITQSNGYLTPDGTTTVSDLSDLEYSATENYLFMLMNGDISIRHRSSIGTPMNTIDRPNDIVEMKFRNNLLYFMEQESPTTLKIYKVSVDTVSLGAPEHIYTINTYSTPTKIFLEVTDHLVAVVADQNYYLKYFMDGTELGPLMYSSNLTITTPVGFTIANNQVLFTDGNKLRTANLGENSNITQTSGECAETVTVQVGDTTEERIFKTKSNNTLDDLFRHSLMFAGRRFFTNLERPFYYFEDLSHNDQKETGGILNEVQHMLGPQALGGFFSEYATCNDLKNAAPISKLAVYRDETSGESKAFNVSVTPSSEPINRLICSPTSVEDVCMATYDLQIVFEHIGLGESEKKKIKLKCGEKLGTYETYDNEGAWSGRSVIAYNTSLSESAKYEQYEIETEDSWMRATVSKFYRQSTDKAFGREVTVEYDPNSNWKSVSMIDFNKVTGWLLSGHLYYGDDASNFSEANDSPVPGYLNLKVSDIVTLGSLGEHADTNIAPGCMADSETDPDAATIPSCYLENDTDISLDYRSGGHEIRVRDMDIENPSNFIRSGVFEIP